jgi:hypothetical protein
MLICTSLVTGLLDVKGGPVFALFASFTASFAVAFSAPCETPSLRLGWSLNFHSSSIEKIVLAILWGLLFGFMCWKSAGIERGLVALAVVPILMLGALGLHRVSPDIHGITGPECILQRDRRAFLGLTVTASVGLVTFVALLLPSASITEFALQIIVLACCATASLGPSYAGQFTSWGIYTSVRIWLAIQGKLPWRLGAFLRDAHLGRGVLRQAGAAYQFRHIEIQHYLSNRP